jgi:cytochrome P450
MATATLDQPLQMPFGRKGVLNISPTYAEMRKETPILPVITPAGDPGWIIISFEEAKLAFADKRFGFYVHHDPANASRLTDSATHSAPMGNFDFEGQSARMRKILTPGFTPRRLSMLAEWVQTLTDKCLDDLEAAHDTNPGQPVDFHDMVGFGLPVSIIGALLGFPEEDSAYVTGLSERMGGASDGKDSYGAAAELEQYMKKLIAKKREDLGQDVISDMIRAEDEDPDFFKPRTIEAFAAGFVFPAHETTVVRMDFGVMYLLNNRQHLEWFLEDPDGRIDQVVDEVLRLTSATNHGLMRYAIEDIEMAGVTIRRGDLVVISESAANRDPSMFDRAEEFDPTRQTKAHLAFGHGSHKCLGMSLAKMELKTVFLSLFRRFPDVRMAIDPADLNIDNTRVGGGVKKVPLIW